MQDSRLEIPPTPGSYAKWFTREFLDATSARLADSHHREPFFYNTEEEERR